jgi:hypothetical protein
VRLLLLSYDFFYLEPSLDHVGDIIFEFVREAAHFFYLRCGLTELGDDIEMSVEAITACRDVVLFQKQADV